MRAKPTVSWIQRSEAEAGEIAHSAEIIQLETVEFVQHHLAKVDHVTSL
jgi:hypothetical protein